MNWKEISEKYPKAFGKFIRWAYPIYSGHSSVTSYSFFEDDSMYLDGAGYVPVHDRWCYDYFDGLGICGYVRVMIRKDDYRVWIVRPRLGYCDSYATRTAAESALFERMFELRESQLLEGAEG